MKRGLQRAALGNGVLIRHVASHLLLSIAEWAIFVGVLVYAYDKGGAGPTGLASVALLTPYAIFAPLTGALAQRLSPQRLRVFGAATQSIGYGVGAIAAVADLATPVVVVPCMIGIAGITTLRPTGAMLLPAIVRSSGELTVGNLWTGYAETVSTLAGPAYATILLAIGGPSAVLTGCAVSAAAAAAVIVFPRFVDPPGGSDDADRVGAIRLMWHAVTVVHTRRSVRSILGIAGAQYFIIGGLDIIIVVAAEDHLGLGETGPGLLLTVFGIGAVLSGFVTTAIVSRRRLGTSMLGAMLVTALAASVMGVVVTAGAWILLLVLLGTSRSTIDVLADVLLHRSAPAETLGSLFAVLELSTGVGLIAGSLVTQALIAIAGLEAALYATGVFYVALAALSKRSLDTADDSADVPVVAMSLLRGVPIFAPLPRAALDGLARAAVEIPVRAGDVIIEQGEIGDRYYAIASGSFDVSIDGEPLGAMSRGTGFGEIALLGDMPRTATVTAATDGLLVAVDRSPFLVTVTGHDSSRQAAWGLIRSLRGERPVPESPTPGSPIADARSDADATTQAGSDLGPDDDDER